VRRERSGQLVGRAGRAVQQRERPRAHERARGGGPRGARGAAGPRPSSRNRRAPAASRSRTCTSQVRAGAHINTALTSAQSTHSSDMKQTFQK